MDPSDIALPRWSLPDRSVLPEDALPGALALGAGDGAGGDRAAAEKAAELELQLVSAVVTERARELRDGQRALPLPEDSAFGGALSRGDTPGGDGEVRAEALLPREEEAADEEAFTGRGAGAGVEGGAGGEAVVATAGTSLEAEPTGERGAGDGDGTRERGHGESAGGKEHSPVKARSRCAFHPGRGSVGLFPCDRF